MGRPAVLLLLSASLLVLGGAPAGAEGRDDLFRALDLERAAGRPAEALAIYRRLAAAADDSPAAAEAALGEVRCLRILGREAEAREAVEKLLSRSLPPELRAAADKERERLAGDPEIRRLHEEVERLRQELASRAGSEEELQALLAEKEDELRRLTERAGATAAVDPADRAARREREERQRLDLAFWYLDQARARYREGRFDEAREWTDRALSCDPGNEAARELRRRLGDEPGVRDHLVRKVLEVLDLERKLRLAEIRAEIDAGLAAGEDLLVRGRLDEAAARFLAARSLADAAPNFAAELALRRTKAEELLERATIRGGRPPPESAEIPPDAVDPFARAELEELLLRLSAPAAPGGPLLRVHRLADLPAFAGPADGGPGGLTLRARPPAAGPLYRTLLPELLHPASFRDGIGFARDLGDELIVHGPAEVQDAAAALFRRVSAGQDPPVRLTIQVLAADPGAFAELARAAGLKFGLGEGAAFSLADTLTAATLRTALVAGGAEELGTNSIEAPSGAPIELSLERSVNLLAPRRQPGDPELRRLEYGAAFRLLAVRSEAGAGLAVHLATVAVGKPLALPGLEPAREIQAASRTVETAEIGVVAADGQTLVATGPASPFPGPSGARAALVVFVSIAAPAGAATPSPAVAGPPPETPTAVDLLGLDASPVDEPAAPFLGERAPASGGRANFLVRHLWEALGDKAELPGTSITLSRGAAWVRGGDEVTRRVREIVTGLAATRDRLVRMSVRAAVTSADEEARYLAGLPEGGRILDGEPALLRVLSPEDVARNGLSYFLAGTDGRIALADEVVARPTQLVSQSSLLRTPYLKGFRTGPDGETWPEYGQVDEGVALEFRPLALPDGRVDLTVALRVARVLSRAADPEKPTARPPEIPVHAVSQTRVRATLAPRHAILVSGLPAPTPVRARRDRLMVLVTFDEIAVK